MGVERAYGVHPHRRLNVSRKAHELALRVYQATGELRDREHAGLGAQLRRAATAVPARIAEGAAHDTPARFAHFLELAIASSRELDYLLLLAADLGAIGKSRHATLEARVGEICGMLVSLRRRVLRQPNHHQANHRPSRPSRGTDSSR